MLILWLSAQGNQNTLLINQEGINHAVILHLRVMILDLLLWPFSFLQLSQCAASLSLWHQVVLCYMSKLCQYIMFGIDGLPCVPLSLGGRHLGE